MTAVKKSAEQPVTSAAPALIAYHALPASPGKQPILAPIGLAFAHKDGEGFTLQLNLMPVQGGQIVLRKPSKVKKPS